MDSALEASQVALCGFHQCSDWDDDAQVALRYGATGLETEAEGVDEVWVVDDEGPSPFDDLSKWAQIDPCTILMHNDAL